MIKLIEGLDDFFKVFIEDGLGRFVFCHIPFWFLTLSFSWLMLANFGPFVVLTLLLCVVPPLIFASIYFENYKVERNFKSLKFAIPIGAAILIIFTGVPHLLTGLMFGEDVRYAYWVFIKYWWKFFNAIQPFKNQLIPVEMYKFNVTVMQWIYWGCAFTLTPVFFYVSYDRDKTKLETERLEVVRLEKEEEENKKRAERERQREAEYQRKLAIQEQIKKDLEAEKQKKLEEIKGKNPWESGFL